MASPVSSMSYVGSLAATCGRVMDKKPITSVDKLSSFASTSSSALGRWQNVVLRKSGATKVNAMAKELYFNKDGSAINKLQATVEEGNVDGGGYTLLQLSSKVETKEDKLKNEEKCPRPNLKEYTLPRLDKSGRFCSPRAARELALLILYASCLEGSDPVRLFDNRLNAPRELDYEFDWSSLLQYDHMSTGGSPIIVNTMEEAEQLLSKFDAESAIEEAVLSAPPNLVYSKLLLRFTRKLLSAVVDRWDSHVVMIDKITPSNWKFEPSGRILEFSILHLAMSEISVLGTKQQIVINEAVDLAKRFCDGAAPRTINGCLRTFVQDVS